MTEIFIEDAQKIAPAIYVVGIGGGGNNAIERMMPYEEDNRNVHYFSINTDYHILADCRSETIQIGKKITGGFGAGADPCIGEAAAKESEDNIMEALSEARMVILTCGLGGGTGTGAIPVIAKLCKDAGILTIAVVTLPFTFEGRPRSDVAMAGLQKLKEQVDTLLIIPNDKLLQLNEKNISVENAFSTADNILRYTIEGITNIIYHKGVVNVDFNDLKTTFTDKGIAHIGISVAHEGTPLIDAVRQAIESPLLDTNIKNATNVLLNTGGHVNLLELNEAVNYVQEMTSPDTQIIWGTVSNPDLTNEDDCIITLIATGVQSLSLSSVSEKPKESGFNKQVFFTNAGSQTFQKKEPVISSIEIPEFLRSPVYTRTVRR
ncbi:MAG: cell division protein FtsZ [Lachnospiraceae bacterium]|nr:cell division protein FtsZ [Lachnospiraceae bacterium]